MYLHPDSPLPLIQPYNIALHPDHVNGPGHGIRLNPWAASFYLQVGGTPYQPSGVTVSTVVGLTVDEIESSTPNGIFVFLYGGPPFSAAVCTDDNTCTRNLSTRYCLVHGIAIAVDNVGELRSATPSDQWVLWEWFRKYVSVSYYTYHL